VLIEFRNGREEGEEDDVVTVVSDKQSKLRDCWGARELVSRIMRGRDDSETLS
jgi:hypothetical protein